MTNPASRPAAGAAGQPWLKPAEGDTRATVTVFIDDVPLRVRIGDSVAAAVLLADPVRPYRRMVLEDSARAPFCMMGSCFDCLVEIDGLPNQQGCLIPVAEGMHVRRQMGLNTSTAEGTP